MLFNSYEFIFLFLPITLIVYSFTTQYVGRRAAIICLVFASLFFYGYWNPVYLLLICASIFFNYGTGLWLNRLANDKLRHLLVVLGVSGNLALLGYFKYAGFIVDNIQILDDFTSNVGDIVLPLAISFFTFQQIAFLMDVYRNQATEHDFFSYCLFVTFFPQLIAGPIVHHSEMLPQFSRSNTGRIRSTDLSIGVTIFAIGLFKKTVLADGVAQYATPVFLAAEQGVRLTFFEAWGGALAYTFQLYFDFSGYSDMAIGAARMFGIRLPMNFYSPYKSLSIIDFWRRWHMTLSRFLRDYLYIPLGGNRGPVPRRYINIFITMVLGGLWHGAGWTFIVWGALHGTYIMINHGWRSICSRIGLQLESRMWKCIFWGATFIAVVVAWVPFRAESFFGASNLLTGMLGLNSVGIPEGILVRLGSFGESLQAIGVSALSGGGRVMIENYIWIVVLLPACLILPSTQEFMSRYRPCFDTYGFLSLMNFSKTFKWRLNARWAVIMAAIGVLGTFGLPRVTEFLYFQF